MTYKTISIKTVIDTIHRDLNLQTEDRWLAMIEWIGEALAFIEVGCNYVTKEEIVEIKNHKGELPCDLSQLKQIATTTATKVHSGNKSPLVYGTQNGIIPNFGNYTINGGYINTAQKEGKLYVTYLAIETDEDGFPLMPDDISYKTACKWYCLMQMKLPDLNSSDIAVAKIAMSQYSMYEEKWRWYCSQAAGKAVALNADQKESIKRQWMRLIPNITSYNSSFSNMNNYAHGTY